MTHLPSPPFGPEKVLEFLRAHDVERFNVSRSQNPGWVPELPSSSRSAFARHDLSGFDLRGMDFSGYDLSGTNLSNTRLERAVLSGANLSGARLGGATVDCTLFVGARGLFGTNRARFGSYDEEADFRAETALFRKKGDNLPWSILRSITTLRIFGASYILMILLVAYAGMVEWVNESAFRWASLIPDKETHTHAFREFLLSKIPLIEVAPHFGIQLLMVLCLAVGATIYEFWCPDLIKENTESRWTRELNQSLIEYRAADASAPRARSLAFFFYGIGGLYTLVYGAVRVAHAIFYFLGALGGVYF